ncbi:LOW QUALITY PROTEIN: hypothetical protein PanWU01x14_057270, partial [Parasponia andersonii]
NESQISLSHHATRRCPLTTQKKPQCRHAPNPKWPVIKIEHVIGAGRFCDADPRDLEEEEEDTKFDISMLNFPGKFEGHCRKRFVKTTCMFYGYENYFHEKF